MSIFHNPIFHIYAAAALIISPWPNDAKIKLMIAVVMAVLALLLPI